MRYHYYINDNGSVKGVSFDEYLADATRKNTATGKFAPFEQGGNRVAETTLPDGRWLSTVFLGLNHSHGDSGLPVLFESLLFEKNGDSTDQQERYFDVEEARAGHARILAELTAVKPEPETEAGE